MGRPRAEPGCYHVGLSFGEYEGHRKTTVVLHARRCLDSLPCELWEYLGEHETTKARLRANRDAILTWVNGRYADTIMGRYGRPFACLIVE